MKRLGVGLLLLLGFALPATAGQSPPPSDAQLRIRSELNSGIGASLNPGQIRSLADAQRASRQFGFYIHERTGNWLPTSFISELAAAEWRARQAGQGTVPVRDFVAAATQLFAATLGVQSADSGHSGGQPYFVITPVRLNGARRLLAQNVPGALQSDIDSNAQVLDPSQSTSDPVQKAYPIEAFLALYICISEDFGRDDAALRAEVVARMGSRATAPSPSRRPYGDLGYVVKRPLSKLLAADLLLKLLQGGS